MLLPWEPSLDIILALITVFISGLVPVIISINADLFEQFIKLYIEAQVQPLALAFVPTSTLI